MKHKVDWLSQQYRIRAEYAHRIAIEAWERQIDERNRLLSTMARTGYGEAELYDMQLAADQDRRRGMGQKH